MKRMDPPSHLPSYGLNDITAVILLGWLWHKYAVEKQYAMKQRNQTKQYSNLKPKEILNVTATRGNQFNTTEMWSKQRLIKYLLKKNSFYTKLDQVDLQMINLVSFKLATHIFLMFSSSEFLTFSFVFVCFFPSPSLCKIKLVFCFQTFCI